MMSSIPINQLLVIVAKNIQGYPKFQKASSVVFQHSTLSLRQGGTDRILGADLP